jgi:hypothetical protein
MVAISEEEKDINQKCNWSLDIRKAVTSGKQRDAGRGWKRVYQRRYRDCNDVEHRGLDHVEG